MKYVTNLFALLVLVAGCQNQVSTRNAPQTEMAGRLDAAMAMNQGTARDNLCSICSEALAKKGKTAEATAVANQLANETARNNLLSRIASGSLE